MKNTTKYLLTFSLIMFIISNCYIFTTEVKAYENTGISNQNTAYKDNYNGIDVNIEFSSDYTGKGFKVNYLKATRMNDNIEFIMDYESSRECDCSLFNPPNGEKIMKIIRGGIKSGNNILKVKLTINEFKKMLNSNEITMKFGFDEKANYIFFKTSQLKSLLLDEDMIK